MTPSSTTTPTLTHLSQLQAAIEGSWAPDTCDPVDLPDWRPDNPARGQCGATALVVNDLLGGELLKAQVHHTDGSRQGWHWWNRIGAVELDLTRAQFLDGEVIGLPQVVARPAGPPRRCAEQYAILRQRVQAALAALEG